MNRAGQTGLLLLATLLASGCPQGDGKTVATKSAVLKTGKHEAGSQGDGVQVDNRRRRGTLPKLESVNVPAGEFVMGSEGSTQGGRDDERPRAKRTTAAFSIDVKEVTNAAYAAFLASPDSKEHVFCHVDEPPNKNHTPGKASPKERGFGSVAEPFTAEGRELHPVVLVDWWDAYAFATWARRRLPSEDEWERAARGVDGRRFPWGNDAPQADQVNALFLAQGKKRMTTVVGAFPKGQAPCGALDMAGNVWEWTSSPYLAYDGAPQGTPTDKQRYVFRGGGWTSASSLHLRGAMRVARPRDYRDAAVGFRTAGSPR